MIRLLAATLLAAVLPAQAAPLRVLFLTGGGFHDFTKNPETLLAGLQGQLALEVTRVHLLADGEKAPEKPEERPSRALTPDLRSRCDVILAYTQGEILGTNQDERDSLLHFVRQGGGFVGLHCAADTFKWSRDYVAMVGGKFKHHPPFGKITAKKVLGDHPVLAGVGDIEHQDEFYWLDDVRLDDKSVLLVGESGGQTRPLAWTKNYGAGRVCYAALGHGPEAYANKEFQKLIANALRWAAAKSHWAPAVDGWRNLFDGKTLAGWTMSGPGRFTIADGELVTDGGMGLLWFSELAFGDFELELEWALTKPGDNAGVFVRFPAPRGPWDAVEQGYEVQICDAAEGKQGTGAVYSFAAATRRASKPCGEWNHFTIRVVGQKYTVHLNRELVSEFVGSRGTRGHIGLQNHSQGEVVRFRQVRVRELGDPR